MTSLDPIALVVAAAAIYLLAAYALGGPVVLGRTLVALLSRRRQRYRPGEDDVLASSRFTIPVSVLLPTGGEAEAVDAVQHLLDLDYPELEIIVVNDGTPAVMAALRERYGLRAYEVFFRRTLETSPVQNIYRSTTDPRLLVADCVAETPGDALNCAVNLARYRYICCADAGARYRRESLLEAMHPAFEDPATVAGVTTVLGAATHRPRKSGTISAALQHLSSLHKLLARTARRRLSLAEDNLPGFTLWRRDVIVDAGGFATDVEAVHLEMTFRVHRLMRRRRMAYRIVHVTVPVGAPAITPSLAAVLQRRRRRQHAMARVLWRYRRMIGNPRYGALGLVDLPGYVFAAAVAPWLELTALLALPFAVLAGVFSPAQLVLALLAIGLGNAVLLGAGLLLTPLPDDEYSLLPMLALAPFEVFLSRPVQLYSRLTALLRLLLPSPRPVSR